MKDGMIPADCCGDNVRRGVEAIVAVRENYDAVSAASRCELAVELRLDSRPECLPTMGSLLCSYGRSLSVNVMDMICSCFGWMTMVCFFVPKVSCQAVSV
jgi:hypothetical protein